MGVCCSKTIHPTKTEENSESQFTNHIGSQSAISTGNTTPDMNLYVIAVVFNPCGFNTRVRLYNEFASRMKRYKNVRLYTAECVYGTQPFSVTSATDPQHIQLRTSSSNVWWIKENLINLVVNILPQSSQYISWMDADIEFTDHNWPNMTIKKLSTGGYKVLQLFREAMFLGPRGDVLEVDKSFGLHVAEDDWRSYAHPGLAWAMRKSDFIKLGGLYDLNPVGSSDLHFAHALIGNVRNTIKDTMSKGYKLSVDVWADRLMSIVGRDKGQYMKTVGYVDVNILHHYHGKKADRQYVSRWNILEEESFDPATFYVDSSLTSNHLYASIRTISPHVSQRFRQKLIDYFSKRNEDNTQDEYIPPKNIVDAKQVYGKPVTQQTPVQTSIQNTTQIAVQKSVQSPKNPPKQTSVQSTKQYQRQDALRGSVQSPVRNVPQQNSFNTGGFDMYPAVFLLTQNNNDQGADCDNPRTDDCDHGGSSHHHDQNHHNHNDHHDHHNHDNHHSYHDHNPCQSDHHTVQVSYHDTGYSASHPAY
ncbi:hypothetical protein YASMINEVIRUS_278 [Yasminevirus sp. GU-2018]|uniref:Uncharacterized protein n=1 Tax=Yasminevirus sp. GU-2018 TaxID=2420051 RepID=A0A5K0U7Q5_9VIRU|nr:hypothetical protein YASMINEVIRUS_278 [Yasminevirus sp. GU-2018]